MLLTFGQPTFKVPFNLSERCRGSERHLNNTVSANILPCVLGEARRQAAGDIQLTTSKKAESIFRVQGRKKKCIFIFKTNVYYSFLSSGLLKNMSVTILYSLPSLSLRIKNS